MTTGDWILIAVMIAATFGFIFCYRYQKRKLDELKSSTVQNALNGVFDDLSSPVH